MPPLNESQLLHKVSHLEGQMDSINKNLVELKESMLQLNKLGQNVNELRIHNDNARKDIDSLKEDNEKTKEYINSSKGAMRVVIWVIGGAQVLILAAAGWAFGNINKVNNTAIEHGQKLEQISEQLRELKK